MTNDDTIDNSDLESLWLLVILVILVIWVILGILVILVILVITVLIRPGKSGVITELVRVEAAGRDGDQYRPGRGQSRGLVWPRPRLCLGLSQTS